MTTAQREKMKIQEIQNLELHNDYKIHYMKKGKDKVFFLLSDRQGKGAVAHLQYYDQCKKPPFPVLNEPEEQKLKSIRETLHMCT